MGVYGDRIFPRLMEWSIGGADYQPYRRRVLSGARGAVLEVGFGTGLNFPHYPPEVTSLTAVDSHKMLPAQVSQRARKAPVPVTVHYQDASTELPAADGSIDTVVSTWTLCSIHDLSLALAEIRRVLKPDGRFLFLEHGRSDSARVAWFQDRLNPLQRLVGRGCNLNRRIDTLISGAGFRLTEVEFFVLPDSPRLLASMYRGVAVPEQVTG